MHRHVLQPLIALALAALFAAPVAAVEPGGASRETLTGTLDALYVETFHESHPGPRFELRTKAGSIPVAFADGSPEDLAGAKVKLTGVGVRPVVKKTNKLGQVSFKVHPKRKGKLLVSATMSGFQPAYGSLRVR